LPIPGSEPFNNGSSLKPDQFFVVGCNRKKDEKAANSFRVYFHVNPIQICPVGLKNDHKNVLKNALA